MSASTEERVAIVTGASGGIGRATCERLLADGFAVVGSTRRASDEVAAVTTTQVESGLGGAAAAAAVVDAALTAHGRVDVLVNGIGNFEARTEGFAAIDDESWTETLEVNLMTAVRAIRAALPALRESEGAIVNISSIVTRTPESPVVDYAAAKAALTNLTTTLAEELAGDGIRVNAVSPGPTMTSAWTKPGGFGASLADAADAELDDFLQGFAGEAGLSTGRMTEPAEVAEIVALLASGRVRNVNGANFTVDGGQEGVAY